MEWHRRAVVKERENRASYWSWLPLDVIKYCICPLLLRYTNGELIIRSSWLISLPKGVFSPSEIQPDYTSEDPLELYILGHRGVVRLNPLLECAEWLHKTQGEVLAYDPRTANSIRRNSQPSRHHLANSDEQNQLYFYEDESGQERKITSVVDSSVALLYRASDHLEVSVMFSCGVWRIQGNNLICQSDLGSFTGQDSLPFEMIQMGCWDPIEGYWWITHHQGIFGALHLPTANHVSFPPEIQLLNRISVDREGNILAMAIQWNGPAKKYIPQLYVKALQIWRPIQCFQTGYSDIFPHLTSDGRIFCLSYDPQASQFQCWLIH